MFHAGGSHSYAILPPVRDQSPSCRPTRWDLFSGELLASCYSVRRAIDSRSSAHSASTGANIIQLPPSWWQLSSSNHSHLQGLSLLLSSTVPRNARINSSRVKRCSVERLFARPDRGWGDKWHRSEAPGGRPEQAPI